MTRDEFEAGGRSLCILAGEDPDAMINGQPAWLQAALALVPLRGHLEDSRNSMPQCLNHERLRH
jgi:hypothetical protein